MDHPFSRRFTQRVWLALGAVGLLATASLAVQIGLLLHAEDDGGRINVSGRQGMLSQRVALHVSRLADPALGDEAREARERALREDLDQMGRAADALAREADGSALPPALEAWYHRPPVELHARTAAYLRLARAALDRSQSGAPLPASQQAAVVASSAELLPLLNGAVELFETENSSRIQRFQGVLVVLWAAMLATLGIVLRRIFAPAARQLHREEARRLTDAAAREAREQRERTATDLARGMDIVNDEGEVMFLAARALSRLNTLGPSELLLADSSEAHLRQAVTHPDLGAPGCSVQSPYQCPAVRLSQSLFFPSSAALDACPRLNDQEWPCAAYCVPVSFMGRAIGVLHSTSPLDQPFDGVHRQRLDTLAELLGSKIGSLRAFAQVQLQASTDPLTGLLNRRAFENTLRQRRILDRPLAVAMLDLDHFKDLNDTHGHEAGDRALTTFAKCLQTTAGEAALVARLGGEEFALALPGGEEADAAALVDAVRSALAAQLATSNLPSFTVSAGVCASLGDHALPTLLAQADIALYAAKQGGRDRVVCSSALAESEALAS